ncbi:MAG: hypothetical protein JWM59_4047 [Verrucomicrobiales bacterium]|nr:hypothetical protein [Verrucomicrobiales bacterium]
MKIPRKMTPPDEAALQPLREVGTMEKTQFWEISDIMEALRVANRQGIPIQRLFHTANVGLRKAC